MDAIVLPAVQCQITGQITYPDGTVPAPPLPPDRSGPPVPQHPPDLHRALDGGGDAADQRGTLGFKPVG